MNKRDAIIGVILGLLAFLYFKGYNVLPLALLGVVSVIFYFAAQKRGLLPKVTVGKGKENIKAITFDAIGGQDTAIRELKEALDLVNSEDTSAKYGIRPLRGILLFGPPGTGKTLLARAAATYTDSVFITAAGSDFIEMYAGVGAQRVRNLFNDAREQAKKQKKRGAIIFIDEIEVLGGKRGKVSNQTEYDQTINQLLVEMDGISGERDLHILVMGATNRPDMLDPALLRPGRFDRQVQVDLPDKVGRLSILKLHTKGKPLSGNVDFDNLSQQTFGFSGAQLESVTNEAAIYALRNHRETLEQQDFINAIEKVMVGEQTDRNVAPAEKHRIAVHETGHAFVAESLRPGAVASLTVIPRGRAMGFMREAPEEERFLHTAEDIKNKIAVLIAGSVAEAVFLQSRSTGAQNDFEKSVELAKTLVFAGLSPLGIVDPETVPTHKLHQLIQTITKEQEARVEQLLRTNEQIFSEIVQFLTEEETISGEQLREVLKKSSIAMG